MNASDVIGYMAQADLWCCKCALVRFNVDKETLYPVCNVHPIFRCEPEEGYCGNCGDAIEEE